MSSNKVDIHDKDRIEEGDGWEPCVIDAGTGIRYGSVEVVVYDGRIVQIERRTRVVKYVANYDRTTFECSAAAGANHQPENAILLRAQVSF
jgi:hypothetical protein